MERDLSPIALSDGKETNESTINYYRPIDQTEERFQKEIVENLKSQNTNSGIFVVLLYIITITFIMLFVFVPLLLVVFTVITDILNQILSLVSAAFVAFKRIQMGKVHHDYTFGQLGSQACWVFYSLPVVTLLILIVINLIGFFFKVLKEQLLDFEYHEKYIHKIKRWILKKKVEERKTKDDIVFETRPWALRIISTVYSTLKESNVEKGTQQIILVIFGVIGGIYFLMMILTAVNVIPIKIVLIIFTIIYLIFPMIGLLDCMIRSWRNVLAICKYKIKNYGLASEVRRIQIEIADMEIANVIEEKLYMMGIGEDPAKKEACFALLESKKEELEKKTHEFQTITFPNLSYYTTKLLANLYKFKIFEMAFPPKMIGQDIISAAVQENTPFLGDFPWVTASAFAIGMGMRIMMFFRDWGERNANSYFPYSIIVTALYIFAGPYIMIMSHYCSTYSFLKFSDKQKAEKMRKVNLFTDMFLTKIKFNSANELNPLLTPYEIFLERKKKSKDQAGILISESESDDEKKSDEDNESDDDKDEEREKNEYEIAKKIAGSFSIDEILEGQGSIKAAAIVVQILFLLVILFVMVCGITVLTWTIPIERICYDKIFLPPLSNDGSFDEPTINNSICSIEINGLTITELAALPILAYFAHGDIPLDTRIHNMNVVIDLAFGRTRTRKTSFDMPEFHCKTWEECFNTSNAADIATYLSVYQDGKLDYNILIPFGMRDKGDWMPVLEMYMQQYPDAFLGEMVPLYDLFMDSFGDVIYYSSTNVQKLAGVRSVTVRRALRIKDFAEELEGDHNIAVGQTIGGYFAKYIGYMLRDRFSAIGFNSLSFQENALCGDYEGDEDEPLSVINIFADSGMLESEEDIAFNYQMPGFDFGYQTSVRPPNATDAFCHTVAMCSSIPTHINFCDRMLGHERFTNTMQIFGREWNSK